MDKMDIMNLMDMDIFFSVSSVSSPRPLCTAEMRWGDSIRHAALGTSYANTR